MDIKQQKWINNNKARLNTELQCLKQRITQLKHFLHQASIELLGKESELQAIVDIEIEMKDPPPPSKKLQEKKKRNQTDSTKTKNEELEAIRKKKREELKRRT